MIGKTISHYKILEKLGEGGMGVVYKAEDTDLKRTVALKFLSPQALGGEEEESRFIHEAQSAAALDHPSICTVHEISKAGEFTFIAMAYVEGESLKGRIESGPLKLDEAVDIGIQVAEGLQEAHEKGVVHRDIKPANIIVTPKGQAKIMDFGLAKAPGRTKLTKTGTTLGTAAYMSPEQARGGEIDHHTDIWSLGVVLYEMISGRLPFGAEYEQALMYSILNESPEPITALRTGVPIELERIVEKAMRRDTETRYQSAAEMVADLKGLRVDLRTKGTRPSEKPFPAGGRRKSSAGLIAGIVLIGALILIGGQFLLERFGEPRSREVKPVSTGPWRNSIAVLPFKNFSPDKDQEFFCHGMTDAIINKLAGLEELKIISLSSVMRYKDTDKDIKEIGEALGVSTILEGSIQTEEKRIRLSAQLINVADDAHLWSQTYDRELESVFAIQDEISEAIVSVLKIELLGNERGLFAKRHTDNLEAYNAYAQGRYLWNKRTERHLMKSIEYFERAVELDPGYALAYAGLADAWGVLPDYASYPKEQALLRAKEAAGKALELDGELAEAYASLGLAFLQEDDNESARPELLRAIELNPGYAYAHFWYSITLEVMGRHEEALEELQTAYELDPLSIVVLTNLLWKRTRTGDLDEATELFERAVELEPSRSATYVSYASALREVGKPDQAVQIYKRAVEADSAYTYGYDRIAYLYSHMEDYEKAVEAATRYVELNPDEPNSYHTLGIIHAMSGDLDQAIANFRKALEIDSKFDASRWSLVLSYVCKEDYANALVQCRELASSDNPLYAVRASVGQWVVHVYQGKFEKTLEMTNKDLPDAEGVALAFAMQNRSAYRFLVYYERKELDLLLAEARVIRTIYDEFDPMESALFRGAEAAILAWQGKIAAADDSLRSLRDDLDMNVPDEAAEYWGALGFAEFHKGDAQTAVTYLRRGLYKSSKPRFIVRYFLGQAYLEAGQPEEAAEVLERVARRYDLESNAFPSIWSVKTHYYLGMAYEESGRSEEAIEQYERFLDILREADPGVAKVEDARERLTRLREGT